MPENLYEPLKGENGFMYGELHDWKNGWHGITLGLSVEEISRLIRMLEMIRDDPEQHFHISSDYKEDGGLGDIEIYVSPAGSRSNMSVSSGALGPGDSIPDPPESSVKNP